MARKHRWSALNKVDNGLYAMQCMVCDVEVCYDERRLPAKAVWTRITEDGSPDQVVVRRWPMRQVWPCKPRGSDRHNTDEEIAGKEIASKEITLEEITYEQIADKKDADDVKDTDDVKDADEALHILSQCSAVITVQNTKLSCGKYTDKIIDIGAVYAQPKMTQSLAQLLAQSVQRHQERYDLVVGVPYSAQILAYEVAHALGRASARLERNEDSQLVASPSACYLLPGSRVLLVDDVLTTGASLQEVAEAVVRYGGTLAAAYVVVDRRGVGPDGPPSPVTLPDGVTVRSLLYLPLDTYNAPKD